MDSSLDKAPPKSPFYQPEHEAFRDMLRRFVRNEIEPFGEEWDESGSFPRELYKKAGDIGLLGVGFPEEYGGTGDDRFLELISFLEMSRCGFGGIVASLVTHRIGAGPIAACGSDAMKEQVLPEILSGEKISALAVTEPDGGSDVANLKTTARRDGDHFVINGSKTFITSGMRADYYTVAVRTGGAGAGGVSLILVERDAPGFTQTSLKKMGWWASDTATLYFDDCRVSAENLIGEESAGFKAAMRNFNFERWMMAAQSVAYSQLCFEEALAYARDRTTFGKPLTQHQVIRHKLVDMLQRIEATKAMLEMVTWKLDIGELPVSEICMLKNQATQTLAHCASEGVQILGGAGFMRGPKVERIYREVKVQAIGGGSEEIMKELASRQLGI